MTDIRMILTGDGSSLQFTGGQPLLDNGLENTALMSLFTGSGWCGSDLVGGDLGSDFEELCNQPITLTALNEIRNAAERALGSNPQFVDVSVTVRNPSGSRLEVQAMVGPGKVVSLARVNGAWKYQAADPAYLKVV